MKQIEVLISPEGEVTITAKGFKGKGCKDATKAIEAALGVVSKDTKSPEYYQEATTQLKANV